MAGYDLDQLRNLSRILFGQALRLEVMIAIARSDGLVNLTDLATAIGVQNASRIQKPLDDLKAGGLLVETEMSDSRRRWLRRSDSLVWQWVLELATEHGYGTAPQSGQQQPRGVGTDRLLCWPLTTCVILCQAQRNASQRSIAELRRS